MLSEDKRIRTKAQLKEWLAEECGRYPLNARRLIPYIFQASDRAILRKHTVLLRKTEYYRNTGRRLLASLYYLRLTRMQMKYHLHVPVNCFEKGLNVVHCTPLVMNPNICIGKNCRVMPHVCIVGDDRSGKAPVIGDNVTLGIGCTVMGDVYLADGITVGAGAVVTKSFYEKGISIAGIPARKLRGPEERSADSKSAAE